MDADGEKTGFNFYRCLFVMENGSCKRGVRFTDREGFKHMARAAGWAKEAVSRGAGEILLTSMDADGEKTGFNHTLTQLGKWKLQARRPLHRS
jgi:imidazole glycerol phosphate synthase subunit HisF